MIGPFLIIIAVFLFLVSFKGKSSEFLQAMFPNVAQGFSNEEQKLDSAITDWAKTNIWDKITNAIGAAFPFGLGGHGSSGSGSSNTTNVPGVTGSGGGGGNNLVGHYTVNLAGGGQMTVNANSPQDAIVNVIAQGGTPSP